MFKSYNEILDVINYVTADELTLAGFDPSQKDSEGIYVLNPVCKALNINLAKQLIRLGANVNAISEDGFTPLLSVIDCSHLNPSAAIKLITLLLENGADIEQRGDWDKTPFLKSCTRGIIEITRLLVEHGCNINAQAKEIDGLRGAEDFADLPSNTQNFKKYIKGLFP